MTFGASGVISVMSNIVPGPIGEMVKAIQNGNMERANRLKDILDPLFKVVTVNTIESYEGFDVPCKFRNPCSDQDHDERSWFAIRARPSTSWKDDP